MATVSTTTIAAITRALTPLINDLYQSAKNTAKNALDRWKEKQFPKLLAKKIGNLTLVRTLWRPDEDMSLLKFYYPPTIRSSDNRSEKQVNYISEITSENIIVQGIVGQGKSIFLRWLALQEARTNENPRLPIFIELRTLQNNYTLTEAIGKNLESYEITVNSESIDHLATSGKLVLLLDAFDELDEALTRIVLNELQFFSKKYEKLQIVITSRPGNEIQKIPGFRIYTICPLTPTDYRPLLEKMGVNVVRNFEITQAIKESKASLSSLITTPLMLTLVAIVYESEREIPQTLPEFFERLFQIVLTRHDRLKDGFSRKRYSELSDRKLQDLFEAFCFMTIQHGFGRSLTNEQFSKVFKQALKFSEDCKCEQEKFQIDIIKGACLMLEEGVDTSTFLHKSLLEYYAAAFVKHSTDEVAELFYLEAMRNHKPWGEVLNFLSSIDPYRFAKHYTIPEIKSLKQKFIYPLTSNNIKDLIKTLNRETNYIGLFLPQDDTYHFGMYSPVPLTYYTGELNRLIFECITSEFTEKLTKNRVEEILGIKIEIEDYDKNFDISFERIINYIGEQPFWKAFRLYEQWLDASEQQAIQTIEKSDMRKNIFLS